MGEGLYRCAVCRCFTLYPPLLLLKGPPHLRMHLSCCVDCMTSEAVPFERYVLPALSARGIGPALYAFFISGRWKWSRPDGWL
jgi:hypothetical protein